MKHPDYDRAFHQTPDYIRSAIELGFMKGRKRMKARRRLTSALTAAAVFVLLLGAGAYGVSRLAANRPDDRIGDARGANVLSAGRQGGTPAPVPADSETPEVTASPTPAPTKIELRDAAMPTPAPEAAEVEIAPLPEAAEAEITPLPEAAEVEPTPLPEAPTPGVDPTAAPARAALDVVYYAEEGSYFHAEPDCANLRAEEGDSSPAEGSGTSGVVVIGGSLLDALRAGKDICPLCLSGWDFVVSAVPSNAAATEYDGAQAAEEDLVYETVRAEGIEEELTAVYAAAGEAERYHRSDSCGDEALPRKISVAQALREGMIPCPDCLPEGGCVLIAYCEADGSQVSAEGLWYTEGGRYFHSSKYCDGMWGASVHPIAEALISGKKACPHCMAGWTVALRCVDEASLPASEPADAPEPTPIAEYGFEGNAEVSEASEGGRIAVSDAVESEEAAAEVEAAIAVSPAYDISHKFYYTPNGRYYHMRSDCSDMTGAKRHSAAETAASGKRHCPVCIGDRIDYYWLPAPREDGDYDLPTLYDAAEDAWVQAVRSDAGNVFAPLGADEGLPHYYHVNPECFGMSGAKMIPWSEAKESGLGPCPACLPVWNSGGSREICYTSGGDALYHADPNCSGVRRASELTELAAQAEGRLRCPLCADEGAPAAWTELREELGASIAAAYPGWSFERADEFDGRTEWFVSDGERAMCAAIFRFAEEDGSYGDSVCELTLEHGDTATRFFSRSFIESLPAPLSAIQTIAHPESIFSLRLEYEGGQLTAFTAGETIGRETAYTSWAIQTDGEAEIVVVN